MPEISRFYGILIKMFHNDHQPLDRIDPLPQRHAERVMNTPKDPSAA